MLSPGNVATPATAATVLVPDKVPVLGFVPIATVMLPVNPVAVLPFPSWAVIWRAGVIVAPATVFVGSTLKTSAVAVAGVMLNAALVAPPAMIGDVATTVDWLADTAPVPAMLNAGDVPPSVPLDAVSVYPVPALSMLKVENVATPPTAVTGPPPVS